MNHTKLFEKYMELNRPHGFSPINNIVMAAKEIEAFAQFCDSQQSKEENSYLAHPGKECDENCGCIKSNKSKEESPKPIERLDVFELATISEERRTGKIISKINEIIDRLNQVSK